MANYLGQTYDFGNNNSTENLFGQALFFQYPFTNYTNDLLFDDSATDKERWAFSFSPSTTIDFTSFSVYLKRAGSVSGSISAELRNDSGSNTPSTTVLTTSDFNQFDPAVDINTANYTKLTFTKTGSPYSWTAGTKLWLVVYVSSGALDGSNNVLIANDNTPSIEWRVSNATNEPPGAWTTSSNNIIVDINSNQNRQLAQGFYQSAEAELEEIHLQLTKTGSPAGGLILQIVEDSGGGPNTGAIPTNGTSQTVLMSSVPAGPSEITFTFSPQPTLDPTKRYHMILSSNISLSLTNNIGWRADSSGQYSGGISHYQVINATSWLEITSLDFGFETYYEEPSPSTPDLREALEALGNAPSDCGGLQTYINNVMTALKSYYPPIYLPDRGGTGLAYYQPGDTLYASSPTHLERLPIGGTGDTLQVGLGGFPEWSSENEFGFTQSFRASSISLLTNGFIQEGEFVYLNSVDGTISNDFWSPGESGLNIKSSAVLLVGVAAQDILPNQLGKVTVFGLTTAIFSSTAGYFPGLPIAEPRGLGTQVGSYDAPVVTVVEVLSSTSARVYVNSALYGRTRNSITNSYSNVVQAATTSYVETTLVTPSQFFVTSGGIETVWNLPLLSSVATLLLVCGIAYYNDSTALTGGTFDNLATFPVTTTQTFGTFTHHLDLKATGFLEFARLPNGSSVQRNTLQARLRIRLVASAANITFAPTAGLSSARVTIKEI